MSENNPKVVVQSRLENSLSAVSLFSGAGGMDIGVMQAGFDILACVEIDPHCCETLRAAVTREQRRTRIIEDDIRNINPLDLMHGLCLEPGDLTLLCGGPPCQTFSQIGKRECLEDDRGMLLFEMTRFAEAFRPKAILIEQVKGLLNAPDRSGKIGGVFELVLERLQALDYVPKWKVLLAADYGVPQMRERVFIISTLKSYEFEFSPPTHCNPKQVLPLFPLPPYITVGEALEGLGEPKPKSEQTDDSHVDVTPAGDRQRIHGVPEGSHLAKELHLPENQRGNLTKKDTTKFRRLSREEPAITLRCGEIFFHPTQDRYLTPREYMRLHGYPDEYLLKGPIRGRSGRVRHLDQHRQIANSVPPPVARVLSLSIKRALEYRKSLKSLAIR
ncbi:MAG: DNA cytosine methyltransferase [Microcoleus sp. SIO2G3]|nr:DNA cytosine methyltransferase [Microcoleus sp. SIO2G3]